jgi:hypothetical protein
MNRSPLRPFVLIPFVLVCFALSQTRAVDPPPDGGYPNQNTAEGQDALLFLDQGVANTAIGFQALFSNTGGDQNTGVGAFALGSNQTGIRNTAIGYGPLSFNTTGQTNTASGSFALYSNTTGSNNTANGETALYYNTTGGFNTAIGVRALFYSTIGSNNIAIGVEAGLNLERGSNNIDIGNLGVPRESNVTRIGRVGMQRQTFISGISGTTVAGGATVMVDANGQLGTMTSSARYKEAVQPMDKASEAVLALHPVTFRYKHEFDPEGIPQFGLVAEDVEKVNPDLVARDEQGKPYTVRYEAVNAMLLNEFLKEHQTVQELKSAAVKQEATIARQQKQIDALSAGLQKVSAQLELSKPAPQTVVNNQ